jgi:hypothetical protein
MLASSCLSVLVLGVASSAVICQAGGCLSISGPVAVAASCLPFFLMRLHSSACVFLVAVLWVGGACGVLSDAAAHLDLFNGPQLCSGLYVDEIWILK